MEKEQQPHQKPLNARKIITENQGNSATELPQSGQIFTTEEFVDFVMRPEKSPRPTEQLFTTEEFVDFVMNLDDSVDDVVQNENPIRDDKKI